MEKIDTSKFSKVEFGSNVSIRGKNVEIKPGARIGNDVSIEALNISIGYDAVIEYGTTIKGLGKEMENFTLGDNCLIGFRNQIFLPEFSMLDFSQLHNSGLHSGYKPLTIGYNCWIGQNTILNATEHLSIGNNVRIGTQSQLWTHVASGELLEGCTLYGNKALVLMDDVWIVGGAVISPGLVLQEKSIIMTGSVLTKSTEKGHTYAGVPAKDVTDKLSFWKEMSMEDKSEMLVGFTREFVEQYPVHGGKIQIVEGIEGVSITEGIVFSKSALDFQSLPSNAISYFDLETKKYRKQRTKIEIDWIKFSVGFRARFIPYNIDQ